MNAPWVIAYGALTIAVILIATLTLGLTRRVLEVLQRVEELLSPRAYGEAIDGGGLRVGDKAPPLRDEPLDADARGALVVFLEVNCEPCRVLAAEIAQRRFDASPYRAVAILDEPKLITGRALSNWVVLSDPKHDLSRAWQVSGTPIAFVVDASGTIQSRRYVNTVKDLKNLVKEAKQLSTTKGTRRADQTDHPEMEMSLHEH